MTTTMRPNDDDTRRSPRVGLQARLVGLVLVILITLLTSIAVVVVWRAKDALDEVDRGRMRASTSLLAESLATGVLTRSDVLMAPTLDAFLKTPELLEVVVLDENDTVLASRRTALPEPEEAVVTVRVPIVSRAAAVDDELTAFGIGGGTESTVGAVVTTFARRTTAHIERGMRRDFVVLFLTFGSIGLLFVFLIAAGVVRRVRGVADAASRLTRGDMTARVHDDGDDELGLLARDFDRMADALGEQRRALEHASLALADKESLAAIGRATAVIAHELKNPLGIVLGAAEVVQNDDKPMEQRTRAARIVIDEVKRLDTTLRQLLQGARPRAVHLAPTDVAVLIENVRTRLNEAKEPNDDAKTDGANQTAPLALSVDLEARLPLVSVDAALTEEVLLNLLLNARDAGATSVSVRSASDVRAIRIFVDDNGHGIDEHVRARLFSPFVTSKTNGTGLGLSSSRRTARDQGGDLDHDPAHKGGTRFVLTLPRTRSSDEEHTK